MTSTTRAVTIEDLRHLARRRIPDFLFGPMDAGAGLGGCCARNIQHLESFQLLPRALVDLSTTSEKTIVFGREYRGPFGISAMGYAGNFRRNADLLLARAAQAADIPFMLSGGSNATLESVQSATPQHLWFQLYGARDPAVTDTTVLRARDQGVDVLVFTVDLPVGPRIEKFLRSGVRWPARIERRAIPYILREMLLHPGWTLELMRSGVIPRLESWAHHAHSGAGALQLAQLFASQVPSNQTWRDVERVRKLWPGKLVIKGIMHPDDALRAAEVGADAVTVSNHGAVKLDSLPATVDVLPSISAAVRGRMPIFFDGGIRSGAGVVVALCLGADFCFVGRAVLYGLIADGLRGAGKAIQILTEEIRQTLLMIGCPSIAELGEHFIFDSARLDERRRRDMLQTHRDPRRGVRS